MRRNRGATDILTSPSYKYELINPITKLSNQRKPRQKKIEPKEERKSRRSLSDIDR